MRNKELENILHQKLLVSSFTDFSPNGLQVEGRTEVLRILTGVTACQALLERAVALTADAIIVHHGYFWKNETAVISGIKRHRLKTLLVHDINLYAYHLPLDAHATLGNNVQLAQVLGISVLGNIEPLVLYGDLPHAMQSTQLSTYLEQHLGCRLLHCAGDKAPSSIKRVAWCTGAGQNFIQQAIDFGIDAFITGEVSEQTPHIARESNIHFYAIGHHISERYGIKALGEWLAATHALEVFFEDIPNPA